MTRTPTLRQRLRHYATVCFRRNRVSRRLSRPRASVNTSRLIASPTSSASSEEIPNHCDKVIPGPPFTLPLLTPVAKPATRRIMPVIARLGPQIPASLPLLEEVSKELNTEARDRLYACCTPSSTIMYGAWSSQHHIPSTDRFHPSMKPWGSLGYTGRARDVNDLINDTILDGCQFWTTKKKNIPLA